MLVLMRRENENIVIDGKVKIKVLGKIGGKYKFGIEAPKNIIVDREEIHIKRMNDFNNQPEKNNDRHK